GRSDDVRRHAAQFDARAGADDGDNPACGRRRGRGRATSQVIRFHHPTPKRLLMRTFLQHAAFSATALLATAGAPAATIYAVNNNLFDNPTTASDHLIRFDSSNPAGYVTIGALDVPGIGFGGLDFDRSGNLWGYASFFDDNGGASSGLYKIDVSTGHATLQ